MFRAIKRKFSTYILGVIIITQFLLTLIYPPKNIISYDVFGYYLYLPQKFIFKTFDFNNDKQFVEVLKEYKNSETFYQAAKSKHTGKYVNKYSCGMSITYSPFFLMAHAYAKNSNYKADGFSLPYQYFLLYGCLLYSILGLIYLRKLLLLFYNEKITGITMLIIFLCTNYLAHVPLSGQGAMSHNVLFTLYAITAYYSVLWHRNKQLKHIVILGFSIGLAALVRPTEIILVLLPLLYGINTLNGIKERLYLLKSEIKQILVCSLIIFMCVAIQLTYFKIYAGKFIYNSYGANPGEGFEFLHPYFLEVLFSFRKGWLIYSPAILIFIMGFFIRKSVNKEYKIAVLTFFLINLYIVASWSCWWYAGSFGQRPLIPVLVFLSLPLAEMLFFIEQKKIKFLIYSFLAFTLFLNIFQTWQLIYGIIDIERMTRAYYFSVFGQTKAPSEKQKKLLLVERSYGLHDAETTIDWSAHQLCKKETLNTDTCKNRIEVKEYNTKYLAIEGKTYSPMLRHHYADVSDKYYVWVKASVKYYFTEADTSLKVLLKVAMEHNTYEYKMRERESNPDDELKPGWHKLELFYMTPEIRNKKDFLRVYIDNRSSAKIAIDSLSIEVFEPKQNVSVF